MCGVCVVCVCECGFAVMSENGVASTLLDVAGQHTQPEHHGRHSLESVFSQKLKNGMYLSLVCIRSLPWPTSECLMLQYVVALCFSKSYICGCSDVPRDMGSLAWPDPILH